MILALDTSCYTTSLAVMDYEGRLIEDLRRPLAVKRGEKGLRQSDALYAHVQNLPPLVEEAFSRVPAKELTAIAVSSRPRPMEGSFMPVFTAGQGLARELAAALSLPLLQYSHQEGHLAAALWSAGLGWQQPFLALHLSGGTGEILKVTPLFPGEAAASEADSAFGSPRYRIELVGDTDLPPGQFVDRIGVALGFPFPAGPHLDKLALTATDTEFRLSGSVKGTHISFSGPESAAQRAISQGLEPASIAAAVFANIGKSLAKAIKAARQLTGLEDVLLMGGVAASQNLRAALEPAGIRFALARYSCDNAVGTSSLAAADMKQK